MRFAQHTLWRNGIAALEPGSTNDALTALHRALAERLRALDLPVESRPYRPHVTMARDAGGSTAPSKTDVVLSACELVLVESRPDGRYVPIALHPAR